MQARSPGLDVVLTSCPPRGFEANPAQTQELLDELAAAEPDLIFLCLGSPKQELWAADNWADLTKSTIICAGAAVDFEAGQVRRAPQAVRSMGAEWLYRLLLEPGRLWHRYLVRGPRFAKIVVRELKQARRERRAAR
jgi:N-acetylglucosaminyldiphosphoundecaprenol N-acetyl-beta-D-mannosaminyltransferase